MTSDSIYRAGPDDPFTASTRPPTQPRSSGDDLTDALQSLASSYAGDPRDWGTYYRDAWTYGIVCGWECECEDTPDEHDCGGSGALDEMASRHGWSDETVERLRRLRAAYRVAESMTIARRAENDVVAVEPKPDGGYTVTIKWPPIALVFVIGTYVGLLVGVLIGATK